MCVVGGGGGGGWDIPLSGIKSWGKYVSLQQRPSYTLNLDRSDHNFRGMDTF